MDKVLLSLKDDLKEIQVDAYEEANKLPGLCYQNAISDYEEQAWEWGNAVREKLITVCI